MQKGLIQSTITALGLGALAFLSTPVILTIEAAAAAGVAVYDVEETVEFAKDSWQGVKHLGQRVAGTAIEDFQSTRVKILKAYSKFEKVTLELQKKKNKLNDTRQTLIDENQALLNKKIIKLNKQTFSS